ncbi:MAG: hypothetical protein Q9160_001711 [Pyrenula sp. 1 TL-2023]
MTENVPPGASAKPSGDAPRGLPYYEKLRRDLRESITKKRLLDRNLNNIEESIYSLETKYLEETGGAGNIIKGFDNYIKGATVSTGGATAAAGTISGSALGGAGRRKTLVNDQDRVFSRSSTLSNRSESPAPSSANTTPSHAATPTTSTGQALPGSNAAGAGNNKPGNAGGNKKNKKSAAEKDEDEDAKPHKRQKISFGGRD